MDVKEVGFYTLALGFLNFGRKYLYCDVCF